MRIRRVSLPGQMTRRLDGQVRNNAGGYAYLIDPKQQLDRFLILGTEGGTYYVGEPRLTLENAVNAIDLMAQDARYVLARAAEISWSGRAYKNDPAIFLLAIAASYGGSEVRQLVPEYFDRIVRTGSHLLAFVDYASELRGWGRGLRRLVGQWYDRRDLRELAYQLTKYQNRRGWTHRDILRVAHPKPSTPERSALFRYITQRTLDADLLPAEVSEYLEAIGHLRSRQLSEADATRLIREHRLPREVVPTEYLRSAEVWRALLEEMPMTAMLRNLATMTRLGAIGARGNKPDEWARMVIERLTDAERLQKARIHPLGVLAALVTYRRGSGARAKTAWTPVPAVVDALEEAYRITFGNVPTTGKRLVLALDVSGSMGYWNVSGIAGLTCAFAAAAMATVTNAVERNVRIVLFTEKLREASRRHFRNLESALELYRTVQFGATDCAQPMLWAMRHGVEADAFVVYTDNETWAGDVHPVEALWQYRERTGIPAKLVVVGMASTGFSIADPNDAGMLDVVGFDTAAPNAIADFIAAL
jgi:60 kDa SS-A/Ro ribonucleoprotein